LTTILCPGDGKMYSDSQASKGDFKVSVTQEKIEEINGYLVGIAGRLSSGIKFKQWFSEATEAEGAMAEHPLLDITTPLPPVEDDFCALVLEPDGTVIMFEGAGSAYKVETPAAIGSGEVYAISAMDAMQEIGSDPDPLAAMRVAIKRDVMSGGEIQVLEPTANLEQMTIKDLANKSKEELLEILGGRDLVEEVQSYLEKEEVSDVG
jgi:ATP-dependent protease HslVU (ClpYQ) peptidase subunit